MKNFDIEFKKIEEEYYSLPKDNLAENISEKKKNIVVFGSGAVGSLLASRLEDLGANIVAFCDNFKTGFNERYQIPIISPEQLCKQNRDSIVVIAVDKRYNDMIYNQVLEMDLPEENIFRRFSGYELYDINEFKKHYDGYKWAFNFFRDELSKKIVLDRIRSYLFYHQIENSYKEQYFEQDVIQLTSNEVFVDGGCYIGDTALEFIKNVNGEYNYIYGFEPDKSNFQQAIVNLRPYDNIEVINKGLWNQEDSLSFYSDNGSSQISKVGPASIMLTSIDNFFAGKPKKLSPTFIKLDIEGAEKQAIIGAKQTIKELQPKLAICVYHRVEDIYELPKIIMEFGSYEFLLRHYSSSDVETVLYAIKSN